MGEAEHRLISGGYQFLPFARSRIKAMRAIGLTFASQKFEVGGVSIRVRITPGHDYIEIGGGCLFLMDSGVVDAEFLVGGIEYPQNYLAGIYHPTNATTAYEGNFTSTSTDGLSKTNPGRGSDGQFFGTVTRAGEFKGKVLVDPIPASFLMGEADGTPIEKDDHLFDKKRIANLCPASTFTGRCRLYVQSIYGAPLHVTGDRTTLFYSLPDKTFQGQPVLSIQSVQHGDTPYADVEVTTSTGVYLDTATGNHWMFSYSGATWEIYPMIADACGETARVMLKPDSGLNAEDRAHLEAYILSTCKPDRKKVQVSSFGAIPPGNTMGYGWHWNYSGTRADIAVNNRVLRGPGVMSPSNMQVMESSHYACTVNITPLNTSSPDDFQQTWQMELSTISAPAKWGIDRGLWCICHPSGAWLEKLTPMRGYSTGGDMPFAGEGTYYVFYKGDELQVCSIKVEEFPADTDSSRWTSSAPEEIYVRAGAIEMHIKTYLGTGWIETSPNQNRHFGVTFKIGARSYGPLYSLRIWSGGVRRSVDAGTLVAYTPNPFSTAISPVPGEPYPYPWPYPSGAPTGSFRFPSRNYTIVPSIGYYYGGGDQAESPSKSATLLRQFWGRATVTVPQNDAEAIYISDDRWEQKNQSSGTSDTISYAGTASYQPIVSGGGLGDMIYSLNWYNAEAISRTFVSYDPDLEVLTKTVETRTLVCRSSDIPTTLIQGNIDAIFAVTADDTVFANFNTVTGTKDGCVALSKGRIPPTGIITNPDHPVVVGWV
jgi:hypothetical protein